jgi:hypothetical protein
MVTIVLTRVRPIPPRVLSRMLSGSFFPVFRAEGLDMALKEYPAKYPSKYLGGIPVDGL